MPTPLRTDVHTAAQRSKNMSAVRSRNTKPELQFRHALYAAGLRYRLNVQLPGKPDIVFIRARVAVFVDGCFWHSCPTHSTYPKTNAMWWERKLTRNKQRDLHVNAVLAGLGWLVLRVWEHEVGGGEQGDLKCAVARVQAVVRARSCQK
jgi:DNA mismatch endonuclease (patch repair protein)